MTKTRSFSIFLLKEDATPDDALKDDNALNANVAANNLPEGARLFLLDNPPNPPWWKAYFGVDQDLLQGSKGALVFVPASGRWFALSFGHVYHNLKDTSYEYDFGLRVTLNCVDPVMLRSTDILEPSGAKRQRTQLPTVGDLTFFDVDADSTILKSLTGKVKVQHKEVFKSATGSSNIRISSESVPNGLIALCEKLYALYQEETYKTAFPDIQNISPVRDPVIIDNLNEKLVEAFREKDDSLSLSVPEIVDHNDGIWATFTGAQTGKVYDDIFLARYYEYLDDKNVALDTIGIDELKRHQLVLTNEDGSQTRNSHNILKCLIFDATLENGKQSYHFCEGLWYLIDADYIARLTAYLNPLCKDTTLPDFNHANEGEYNLAAAAAVNGRVCMDKKSITPAGQKAVEPCDIYEAVDDKAVLHHVKISTLSAQLSHLFNQGINSVNLIRSENKSLEKMKALAGEGRTDAEKAALTAPLENDNFRIVYGIVTHKNKDNKSLNLPLFSRISLMRCMKEFRRMGVEAEYCFIPDKSPKKGGKQRKRKTKTGDIDGEQN
jgi:uncharacterized protein (TIGR04141 family)